MSSWLLAMLLGFGLGADGAGELDSDGEPNCRVADVPEGTALYDIREDYPGLPRDPRWGRLFAGTNWFSARAWTQADPQGDLGVVELGLFGERRPPSITVPLMLPPPLKGTLTVRPRPEGRRWCAHAQVELRQDESLHAAELRLPATLSIQVTRGDGATNEWSVRTSGVRLTAYSVDGLDGAASVYIGDPGALPEGETIAPAFREYLAKMGVKPEEALRSAPGSSWDRALFEIILSDLEYWLPGERPAIERLVLDLAPARFKDGQRQALGYWKGTFARAGTSSPSPGTATLVPSRDSVLITLAIPGRILAKGESGKRLVRKPVKVEIPPGRLLRLLTVTSLWSVSGPMTELHDQWLALAPGAEYGVGFTGVPEEGRAPGVPHRDCVSVTFEDRPEAEWELAPFERSYRSGQVVAPPQEQGWRRIFLGRPRDPETLVTLAPRRLNYLSTHDGTYAFVVKRSGEVAGSFEPDRIPCR